MSTVGVTILMAFLLFLGVVAAGLHRAAERERHEEAHRKDNEPPRPQLGGDR